jgi:hypothetical protein
MGEVLFCPFCGEAFEGESRCPEHDLLLVTWHALAPRPDVNADEEPLPWYSPRLGRGWLAVGAACTLVAFVALPLADVDGSIRMSGNLLQLALQRAPKLWLVPAAAIVQFWLLHRRRSPRSLRSARLAAAWVACVPSLMVYLTWRGAHDAVALMATRTHQPLLLHAGLGAIVVALAGAVMLVACLRLGVSRGPDFRPHDG